MGPEQITITLAVTAGLLSFVSPCVLPLMPVFLSYLTGVAVAGPGGVSRYKIFTHALMFIIGFTTIFVLVGATAGLVFGAFVKKDLSLWLMRIGGVVIILFGIYMSGLMKWLVARVERPSRAMAFLEVANRKLDEWILPERRYHANHGETPGYVRSGVLGMSFAAGWTPCIGPLLGAVLTLAAGVAYQADVAGAMMRSMMLLLAYSLGLAVPFLLTALVLAQATGLLRAINRHGHIIEKISAVFLILVGVVLLTGSLSTLNAYFSQPPDWLIELENKLISE